jgi:hypothetical protein
MNSSPEKFQVKLPHLNEKQMGLVIISLWLCLRFFFENMVKTNGVEHAYKFKNNLVQNMKNADVTGLTFHNETDALTAVLDLIDKLITFGDDKGPGDKG